MNIKSNTTNQDLPWRFGLYQRPSSEENGTNSSSVSCVIFSLFSDVNISESDCRQRLISINQSFNLYTES